jgi:hypothetical protein
MRIIAAITTGLLFATVGLAEAAKTPCTCPAKVAKSKKAAITAAKDEKACVKINKACKWEAPAATDAAAAPAATDAAAPAAEASPAAEAPKK